MPGCSSGCFSRSSSGVVRWLVSAGSKAASACMQVVLVSRYWTWPFIIFVLLSYWLVFPFEVQYLPSCAAPCPL